MANRFQGKDQTKSDSRETEAPALSQAWRWGGGAHH